MCKAKNGEVWPVKRNGVLCDSDFKYNYDNYISIEWPMRGVIKLPMKDCYK